MNNNINNFNFRFMMYKNSKQYPSGSEAIHDKKASQQEGGTCYAHAVANAVIGLWLRVFKFPARSHEGLVKDIVKSFGSNGASIEEVMVWISKEWHGIKWQQIDRSESIKALKKGRIVIACIQLDENKWDNFREYYNNYETGVLSN